MNPSLSFIIPAYNEEGHLTITVEETMRALRSVLNDFEIIIVNDGSQDKTPEIADALAREHREIKVIHHKSNKGFGTAMTSGIAVASKEFIGWVSADTTWPEKTLKDAIHLIGTTDMIITYPSNRNERPLLRRLVSFLFILLLDFVFLMRIKYFNGGSIHKTRLLKSITIKSKGLTFWAEALIRLAKSGHSYREIPYYNVERTSGQSKAFKLKNILASLEMVIVLIGDLYFGRAGHRLTVNPAKKK